MVGELKTVLGDFINPASFEAVWANDDHPVGLVELAVPRELSQRAQGFAEALLEEPADAALVAGELEGGDLDWVERAHRSIPIRGKVRET